MNSKQHFAMIALITLLVSCGSSNFNGGGGATAQPKPQPQPQPVTEPQPQPTPAPPCVPGNPKITVASLTTQVDQFTAAPVVTYELTLDDCPGATPQAMASVLLFDVNAVVKGRSGALGATANLGYTVTVAGDQFTATGSLMHRTGKDLFGHIGMEYGFYQTDKQIQFSAKNRKATITVNLSEVELVAPTNARNATGTSMVIDTYFKFGDSPAVTVPVTFTRKN